MQVSILQAQSEKKDTNLANSMESWSLLVSILVFTALVVVEPDPIGDKQALLDFVNSLPHSRPLNWNRNSSVCNNWIGVTCSEDGSRVVAVRLPGVGFTGPFPANTLSRLSGLEVLSLRSNGISGGFPTDLYTLKNLSFMYLQLNNLVGPLPVDWSIWGNLTIVNLSNNAFNGSVPSSISSLSHLVGLNLGNNLLTGEIPDLDLPSLQLIDLSNNNLSGQVPRSLGRFPDSAFAGNNISGGGIGSRGLPSVTPPNFRNAKPNTSKGMNQMALLAVVAGSFFLGFLLLALIIVFCVWKKKVGLHESPGKLKKGGMLPEKAISRNEDAGNRMVFFEGCNYAFDLEDLLTASAEILGKGTFGMAYRATLEDATVVVKRLKEVSAGKREFEQQMEIIGSIRHENVVELKAYYHSKDEKLMVCEYYNQGSVSSMLHGNRGGERIPLDWDTRMKIAIGAARGIARVHAENGGKFVHGNVKASNIFLNSQGCGCVSDHGLSAIMSPLAPPVARAAGYRAPEVTDTRKAVQPSDVYSFGVVLLELLTAKSPIHTTGGDEIIHLVRWVHSVVREEWTAEVFDIELMRYPNIEEELVEMLQIAMSCVARVPDLRPKMADLVTMLESVRRINTENRLSPASGSGCSTPLPP